MRTLSLRNTALALVLACFALSASAYAAPSMQDITLGAAEALAVITIYPAKTIITMDKALSEAEAVAVRHGKIVAVGSLAHVKARLGNQPVVIDTTFKDHIIVPGLIDQHIHPLLSALTMTAEIISMEDWVLPGGTVQGVDNRADYLKRLAAADKKLSDPHALLLTWGFHHYFHGKLTRADLDAINSQRPIIVWHRSAHELILNSPALQQFGLTEAFIRTMPASAQKQCLLREGHFWEQGALAVLPKIGNGIVTPERLRQGLEFTEKYLHANGITTACEPGGIVSRAMQQAQNEVLGDPLTPFRFYYIPDGKTMAQLHVKDGRMIAETEKMLSWGQGHTAFLPKQVKLFADGAIFSQLMQMKDGYLDGHKGEWMIEPEIFAEAFRQYWDAGYQIHIHQNGDAGLAMIINALQENMLRNPRYDHRTTIVHFGFSDTQQVAALKELGAIVSANPYYTVALADKYSASGIGPQRANAMVRLGDVVRQGISISLHSDMPMAPAQPLFLMWSAVNRTTPSGRVAGPEQRISPTEALKAVTIDAAYSLRLEDSIGSIEAGKDANFTILEANPLTVDPMTITNIGIWGTVLEGRLQPL